MAKRIDTTATRRPTMGAEKVKRIAFSAVNLVPRVRAAHGLASALVSLYQPRLEDAEEEARHLGNMPGNDHAAAYSQACMRAQELRGLVAIVTAAAKQLDLADYDLNRLLAMTKGGAQ